MFNFIQFAFWKLDITSCATATLIAVDLSQLWSLYEYLVASMVYALVSQLQRCIAASMVTRNPLGTVYSTLSCHDSDCNNSSKYNRTQSWAYYTTSVLSTPDFKLKLAYYSQ